MTLGDRNLKKGLVEIKTRKTGEVVLVKKEEVVPKIKEMVAQGLEKR